MRICWQARMRPKFILVSRLKYFFFRDRGVRYAGPLPDEMKMALDYEAYMLESRQKSDAVEMLFAFLKTEESQNLFAQTGVG